MPDSAFNITDESLLPVLAELEAQEPIFHRPTSASSLDDLRNLMAPGYWEVGASGRRYSRAFIASHLAENPPIDAEAAGWQTSDIACRQLAADTFLLTYTLDQGTRKTRRATLWQRSPTGWQILYHQGTPVTMEATDDTAPPNAT